MLELTVQGSTIFRIHGNAVEHTMAKLFEGMGFQLLMQAKGRGKQMSV